jgi:hypothetical protein
MRFLLSFALDNGLMIGYPGQQSGTHCPAQEATWISLASWDLLGLPTKEVMAVTEKKIKVNFWCVSVISSVSNMCHVPQHLQGLGKMVLSS